MKIQGFWNKKSVYENYKSDKSSLKYIIDQVYEKSIKDKIL